MRIISLETPQGSKWIATGLLDSLARPPLYGDYVFPGVWAFTVLRIGPRGRAGMRSGSDESTQRSSARQNGLSNNGKGGPGSDARWPAVPRGMRKDRKRMRATSCVTAGGISRTAGGTLRIACIPAGEAAATMNACGCPVGAGCGALRRLRGKPTALAGRSLPYRAPSCFSGTQFRGRS
jgi:hypothetical protein